ncbi:hypothetical protein [Secundilactobacillus yichangensis]|uniref:hypothetical protein n=1 Tax=Secundilactobacillus yichangensis TaxID=2799580 RepID=UPI00194443C8|nr:hypothetical protein [Secundilactobacillus yichangensis]
MAFQTHYNFGGAKTHNGGSKSAAKKELKRLWQFIQSQGAQLSDPVMIDQVASLQHDLLAYGTRMVNSYRVSGGTYDAVLKQYVSDCGAYLNQFLTADVPFETSRQTFMIQFEHRVNQLIRHYETVITKG